MQKYQDTVTKTTGGVVPLATVTVQTYPAGLTATIYSDNGVTTTANPITCDSNGNFAFYAADGRYQLVISGTGITPRTVSDIILDDTQDSLTFASTNVLGSWSSTVNSYNQLAVQNKSTGTTASAELALYPDNGNESNGWAIVGVNSSGNADPVYTVLGQNEAYLIGSSPSGAGKTGNLVLATGNTGSANAIQFYTGGFTQAKSAYKMQIASTGNVRLQTAGADIGNISSINGGQFSLRNKLTNGAMAIDQRNSGAAQTITAAAALAYTVDRWYAYSTGASVTGQRVAGTAPSQYNYQFTGAASVTKIGFAQRIEAANCQDLAGTTATLSAFLSNSLLTTVTWTAWYANSADAFGTLASPTRTQIATGSFTVNSTLTRYSTNITIPGAATTGIEVEFSVGAQVSGTFVIGRAQLEIGSVASSFEHRQIAFETSLCQRYYYRATPPNGGGFATGYCQSGTSCLSQGFFPVTMRAIPSALEQSGTAAHYTINNVGLTTACSAVPVWHGSTSVYGYGVQWTVASGLTAGFGFQAASANAAAYLGWSAEL